MLCMIGHLSVIIAKNYVFLSSVMLRLPFNLLLLIATE